MSSKEMNLTVQNGFPIKDFSQGRINTHADDISVQERWLSEGVELAASQASAFTTLYGELLLTGAHPEVAFQTALDALGIEWQFDKYLITDRNKIEEIDFTP